MSSYNRLYELTNVADVFEREVELALMQRDIEHEALRATLVEKYSEEGIQKVEKREIRKRESEYDQYRK